MTLIFFRLIFEKRHSSNETSGYIEAGGCSVISILIIFHCENIDASYIYLHDYSLCIYLLKLVKGTVFISCTCCT